MTRKDSLILAKEIKHLKPIPAVANQAKIQEFMDCGAAGYITKPFTPEIIRDLINNILGEADYDEGPDDSDEDFDF